MQLGIIKKEIIKTNTEKYDFPVITVCKLPVEGERTYRIEFNKAAVLAVDCVEGGIIGFAKENNNYYLGKADEGYTLAKTSRCIASKQLSELIVLHFTLDNTIDNDLQLVMVERGIFQINKIGETDTQLKFNFTKTSENPYSETNVEETTNTNIKENLQYHH